MACARLTLVSGVLAYMLAWVPYSAISWIAVASKPELASLIAFPYWTDAPWIVASVVYSSVLMVSLILVRRRAALARIFACAGVSSFSYIVGLGMTRSAPERWGGDLLHAALLTTISGALLLLIGIPPLIALLSRSGSRKSETAEGS